MTRKVFAQVLVVPLLLLAFFGTPINVLAGGVCGGTYIVEKDQTLEKIAALCGTTVATIYAANPGITSNVYTGQTITVPGSNYINPSTYTNPNPNYYNNPNNYAPIGTYGNYVIQVGDTFSIIASRYGISVSDLWAANPNITDINVLYVGQIIYLPASNGQTGYGNWYPIWTTIVPTPSSLSYGTAPAGSGHGTVLLVNRTSDDIYVSLQGTTRDGVNVINEYPVSRGSMKVKVPAGSYTYVAWVGGQKFEGQFHLGNESDRTLTFSSNKVDGG